MTGGWYRRAHEIRERWQERLRREPEYCAWPVRIDPFGWWSAVPLTLALARRGHELLTDLYEDPQYVRTLLDCLTEAAIARVRAHARFFGMQAPPDSLWCADALQMLSVKTDDCTTSGPYWIALTTCAGGPVMVYRRARRWRVWD